MLEKPLPYKRTVFCLMLLFVAFFGCFLKLSEYIGINLGNASDDKVSIIMYSLAFISLLLALRVCFLHISYFRNIYGEWTSAGKARWRYSFFGAITVAFICLLIDYLHIPRLITTLLEVSISVGVTIYFYVKYLNEFSNDYIKLSNAIKSKPKTGKKRE